MSIEHGLNLTWTKYKINLFCFHSKDIDVDAAQLHRYLESQQQFREETGRRPTYDDETRNKFYEVDAHGDDYVDFGALTGQNGAFSWHANFPLE